MSVIKFKISLTRCKKHGLYDSESTFLDLEKALQSACKFSIKLAELRSSGKVDQYREFIHQEKSYEKTSIAIQLDLPQAVVQQYGLEQGNASEGKELFQADHIFAAKMSGDQSSLREDIADLEKRDITATTREALSNARIGQGKFRSEVLALWGNRCCVTGSKTTQAIKASHIKPWKVATDEERLDPYNGLPLVANLDALFEAGLISFTSAGELIVSKQLPDEERSIFESGLKPLVKLPHKATAKYLEYHREWRFFDET
ncbi:MAG: hypothetical protein HP491_18305 [Nitrospira sp.]|nr:hypothetical protein [Nitrospira sp.]